MGTVFTLISLMNWHYKNIFKANKKTGNYENFLNKNEFKTKNTYLNQTRTYI